MTENSLPNDPTLWAAPVGPPRPGGPPIPDARRGNRRLLLAITGVLVAFAAIVTTVLVLVIDSGDDGKGPAARNPPGASQPADRGSDEDPPAAAGPSVPPGGADQPGAPSTLSVTWSQPSTTDESTPAVFGRWITPAHVYLGAEKTGLVRYDLATGAAAPVELPPGAVVCGMSPGTDDGVGGVAWSENAKDCNRLALVDLATGRLRWTVTFSAPSPYNPARESYADVNLDYVPMTFSDNALVVGVHASISARSKTDGAELWTRTTATEDTFAPNVSAVLSDGTDVLVVAKPILTDTVIGARYNAATGDAVWSNVFPIGRYPSLRPISVNPQMFVARFTADSGKKTQEIVSVDGTGKITNRLPAAGSWGELDLNERAWGQSEGARTFSLAVDNGVLYATTASTRPRRFTVVAIDAATGSLKWQVDAPRDTADFAHLSLAGVDADFVYAVTGGFDVTDPVEVHRWGKSDGAAATLAVLPQPPKGVATAGMDQVWSGGRLVSTASTFSSGPSITVAAK